MVEWATLALPITSITALLVTQAADTHSRAAEPVDTMAAAAALAAAAAGSTAVVVAADSTVAVVVATAAVVVDTGNS